MRSVIACALLCITTTVFAAQEPARVSIDSLSAITDAKEGYRLSNLAFVAEPALRLASVTRKTDGARCRLIAWCVKRSVRPRETPILEEQAIVGVWFGDGTVGLFSMGASCFREDSPRRWQVEGRFTRADTYELSAPMYASAADVERDRSLVGEFLRTTEFGYYGVMPQDAVLYIAADREWLGKAIVDDVARGLDQQEKARRYQLALEALFSVGDPLLPWDEDDSARPGPASKPASKDLK